MKLYIVYFCLSDYCYNNMYSYAYVIAGSKEEAEKIIREDKKESIEKEYHGELTDVKCGEEIDTQSPTLLFTVIK